MANNNDTVKEMRAKIIDFIKSRGGQAQRSEIKEYLGLEQYKYYEFFNKALKTKKLVPIHQSIEIMPGLCLGRPVVVEYRLA